MSDSKQHTYTFTTPQNSYTLEVEAERTYKADYEREEKIFDRAVKHHGRLFTYNESLDNLQEEGFERHLAPSEFSQIFLEAISHGLKRESLDGVVKDICSPQKALTPELDAEYHQKKYHKKKTESKDNAGNRIIQIKDPVEKMPDELYARWFKAQDHDHRLRHSEFTSVMLTAFANPSRIVAYIEPQNIAYDQEGYKYRCQGKKIKANEIKVFPLKMKYKLKIPGTLQVQGFFGRFAPTAHGLPDFHLNASVEQLHKLSPDLVEFLWGHDYKTIKQMVQKDEMGKRFLKDSFVMSLEKEGDLIPLLIGSAIESTPLYVSATSKHPTANSRGARVLK